MLKLENKIKVTRFFRRFPSLFLFMKYCLVGLSTTLLDFFIYYSLTRYTIYFYYNLFQAAAISFLIAVVWSYIWHKLWTFKAKKKKLYTEFFTFFIVCLLGLALHLFIMFIGIEFLKLNDLLTKAIAIIVVVFWNFFINKNWTFK
jgi:putative flippase GtrA